MRPDDGTCDRDKRSVLLFVVAMAWLPVVARYVPWTYHIAREAIRGTELTVDRWTLTNPFLTVLLVPASVALNICRRGGAAAVFLLIPAAGWVLHEVFVQHLHLLQEPIPPLVGIQLRSLATLVIVGGHAVWHSIRG
jgi:hypothetical protein